VVYEENGPDMQCPFELEVHRGEDEGRRKKQRSYPQEPGFYNASINMRFEHPQTRWAVDIIRKPKSIRDHQLRVALSDV